MSEGMLLPASSNRGKPPIPFSLNDKSTDLLDNTSFNEANHQPEPKENKME
jgi:hypothetical protein